MAYYNESDLIYSDYNWTSQIEEFENNVKQNGEFFNRHLGNDILIFINSMAEIHNLRAKVTGEKIEEMIREYLPLNIKKREKVLMWIYENWKIY